MIYSVYIINKAGGLIYDEDFSWNKNIEEHTWQQHPIPLVFTADTGRVLVKFGELNSIKPGYSVIAVNRQSVSGTMGPADKPIMEMINNPDCYPLSLTFGKGKVGANEKLMLASMFHSLYAIASKISPVEGSSGIQQLVTDEFSLHCFQTITGVKFFVIVDHKQTACEPLLHRIYELYTDFVLKNPFYLIDMPIRCELFDQNLRRVIEQVERASAYSSATLA
ncbi:hypothetical protein ACHWQZ_G005760 [Mnemiopsis leidyi]